MLKRQRQNAIGSISHIQWGKETQCYYDSELLIGKALKFYNSFMQNGIDYKIGDTVYISMSKYKQKIFTFKCLFEENGKPKSIVEYFLPGCDFYTEFSRLDVISCPNEVVLCSSREDIIDINTVFKKCKVIFGHTSDTVETIPSENLNEQYFLCRYQYTDEGKLKPVLENEICNDIYVEEIQDISGIYSPNKTPVLTPESVQKFYTKKHSPGKIEIDTPQKNQVKRNLNDSFNESFSHPKYSIVEQNSNDTLKIKLRVCNGKVLTNIPQIDPVVLLDNGTVDKHKKSVYELKSPSFQLKIQAMNENKNNQNENVVAHDLMNMVENLKIQSSLRVSPRKLRKPNSTPMYSENFSDSESDTGKRRRKSMLNRIKSNDKLDGTKRKSATRRKLLSDENVSENKKINAHDYCDSSNDYKSETNLEDSEKIKSQSPQHILRKRSSRVSEIKSAKKNNLSKAAMEDTKRISNTRKLFREANLTPSIDQRRKSVVKNDTPLILARNNLHVSFIPTTLPCREKEYIDIYNFIEGKLLDKCGGCMYISGVPGTGKTATVTSVMSNLIDSWKKAGNSSFNYVSVNGMRLTEPRQCYVEIVKQLTGKRVPWEQALSILEKKFTTKSNRNIVPTVLLVDELDILCTKRQDVVYNLLDWPTKSNAELIVVTIANTMDLPERLLMSRVTSRLGLTRLTFQAYTHKQLQEIVIDRLVGNNSFKSDAVQFVARKVASVSGDARRALDICRRSAEIAEIEGPNTQVSMKHVNDALEAMITQPKVKAIAHCSRLEKLILKSIIAEVERTGVEETIFGDVFRVLGSLAALEGFKMVTISAMAAAVYRLSSCRLLLADQKCVDFNKKLILNVSEDDVYYALKNDD